MESVKLEINGKRIIAESGQTVLDVARRHGIEIPTLCHDPQLEPFASCFLCVVKVKGARTLLPACTTKISPGMVVETDTPEIRDSRKAALELLLSNHYADCLGPCQLACPAGVDIQGYLALAALGKNREAIELIKAKNPLPTVCGRVCTRPCEVKGCRRNLLDEPVGIDFVKRYLADLDLASHTPWRPKAARPNGKRVAIVGAGPAGLSCAYYLAIKGYAVQIFEAMPEPGGMLRYGIPEYRLPKKELDAEIGLILRLGVKLTTGKALGKDFTIAGLRKQGYGAIFVGIGAWESSKMRVPDEDAEGVLAGIDFLREYGMKRKKALHGRVLVVGGGNTAIDCARTALRLGAGEVQIVYRRTRKEMPANQAEIRDAEQEGVKLTPLVAPMRVLKDGSRAVALECQRMELGEPDASGRRSPKPIKGSEFQIPCDWIIAAIGQNAEVEKLVAGKIPNSLPSGEALNLTRWKTIDVRDQVFETTVEGVFAGGDVVTGAATAIEAIAGGRKAAHAIDSYLSTGKAKPEPVEVYSRKDLFRKVSVEDLRSQVKSERRHPKMLPAETRIASFEEVEKAYTAGEVAAETARCQECGCLRVFDCDLRRYATDYGADAKSFLGEAKQHQLDRTHPLIELDPNKCILCGRCVRICSELVGIAAYGYIQRGFNTVVKPSLGGSLLDTACVACGLCVETCPTAAIAEKSALAKPGPWVTKSTPTVCTYCGVGCRLSYQTYGNLLVKVSHGDPNGPVAGNHCRKGRFGYRYAQAADRLVRPRIRAKDELTETSIGKAIAFTAKQLKELRRHVKPSQVAVFVSPRMTNEEIFLAKKLARGALGTTQVTSLSSLVNLELACPEVQSTATYQDVEDAQAILAVNADLEQEHFVAGLACKKAMRKGARLIYIGPREDGISRFADVYVRCEEGEQAAVMAELSQPAIGRPELAQAARILEESPGKVMIFDKDHPGLRRPGDERVFAQAAKALGCKILAMREKSNMQGLSDILGGPSARVAAALKRKGIKVALILGEDPLGDEAFPGELREGLLAAEFLVVGDLFLTATAERAHAVFPLSSTAETSGTVTNQEGRVQSIVRAVSPVSGAETWQVLCQLGSAVGAKAKLRYKRPAEITDEIRRALPSYRSVKIDAVDATGIRRLRRPGALKSETLMSNDTALVKRVPTLGLDTVEVRFTCWHDQLFRKQATIAHLPEMPASSLPISA